MAIISCDKFIYIRRNKPIARNKMLIKTTREIISKLDFKKSFSAAT
jgi:hypothetical protein